MNVTVGLVNSHYVEIKSGLHEGDQVIYAGYESLKEGDPVVPTEWGPQGPLTLPPATGEEKAVAGIVYTCPMHPDVRMDKPGNCPKCGMKLVPVKAGAPAGTAAQQGSRSAASSSGASEIEPAVRRTSRPASGAKVTYTCPMHPDVHSDKPGKCPKCGMDLVPASRGGGTPGTPVTGGSR